MTEKLQHRKKAISSPSISRSSRTSGRSSKRNSKESQTEVVDCQKLLEFSFGEKEANAEQEINYFKFPNSFNEQNQKRRSSVHIFFDDIKKKLGTNPRGSGTSKLKQINTNESVLSFENSIKN